MKQRLITLILWTPAAGVLLYTDLTSTIGLAVLGLVMAQILYIRSRKNAPINPEVMTPEDQIDYVAKRIVDKNRPKNLVVKAQRIARTLFLLIPLLASCSPNITTTPQLAEYDEEYYVPKDTVPDKFSKAEKLGAIVFTGFIIYSLNKEE